MVLVCRGWFGISLTSILLSFAHFTKSRPARRRAKRLYRVVDSGMLVGTMRYPTRGNAMKCLTTFLSITASVFVLGCFKVVAEDASAGANKVESTSSIIFSAQQELPKEIDGIMKDPTLNDEEKRKKVESAVARVSALLQGDSPSKGPKDFARERREQMKKAEANIQASLKRDDPIQKTRAEYAGKLLENWPYSAVIISTNISDKNAKISLAGTKIRTVLECKERQDWLGMINHALDWEAGLYPEEAIIDKAIVEMDKMELKAVLYTTMLVETQTGEGSVPVFFITVPCRFSRVQKSSSPFVGSKWERHPSTNAYIHPYSPGQGSIVIVAGALDLNEVHEQLNRLWADPREAFDKKLKSLQELGEISDDEVGLRRAANDAVLASNVLAWAKDFRSAPAQQDDSFAGAKDMDDRSASKQPDESVAEASDKTGRSVPALSGALPATASGVTFATAPTVDKPILGYLMGASMDDALKVAKEHAKGELQQSAPGDTKDVVMVKYNGYPGSGTTPEVTLLFVKNRLVVVGAKMEPLNNLVECQAAMDALKEKYGGIFSQGGNPYGFSATLRLRQGVTITLGPSDISADYALLGELADKEKAANLKENFKSRF